MKTSAVRLGAAALLAACLASPGLADDGGQDLVGTWKREDGKIIRLDWDAQAGELTGTMLDPPENDVTHQKYGLKLHLHRDGTKVTGKAVWRDMNPKTKGYPSAPDYWEADALWEFSIVGPGQLKGRSEGLSFGKGKVYEKGWDEHTLERLPLVTLGGRGKAPEKVEKAAPIDEAALAGSWKTSRGLYVRFRPAEKGLLMEYFFPRESGPPPTPDPKYFPQAIRLANEGDVLRGLASWEGGVETKVELALTGPGRLEGRTETVEGGERGWTAFAVERLPRLDAGPPAGDKPLAAGVPGELAALDWKRDDGLYLTLTKTATGYTGELLSRSKEVQAEVTLTAGPDNKLVGKAHFLAGAKAAASWELAPRADGTLEGRGEFLDWDPADKAPADRGATARTFKPLKRVG